MNIILQATWGGEGRGGEGRGGEGGREGGLVHVHLQTHSITHSHARCNLINVYMLHMQARRIVHATLPVPHSNPIHLRLQEDCAGVGKTVTSSECSLPKNKGCLMIQQHSNLLTTLIPFCLRSGVFSTPF